MAPDDSDLLICPVNGEKVFSQYLSAWTALEVNFNAFARSADRLLYYYNDLAEQRNN